MFNLEQSISAWRKLMLAAGIQSPVPLEELEAHLREQIHQFTASGKSEADAFRLAANSLGDGKTLRSEFSKVNRHWFWIHQDNPLSLKILAAGFIIAGFDPLITALRPALERMFHGQSFMIGEINLLFPIWFLRILIGLGLLRRDNFWRWDALILSGLSLSGILFLYIAVTFGIIPSLSLPHPATDFFMGIELPFAFTESISALNLALMAWAFYVLNQPSIRALFHPRAKKP